MLPPTWLGLGWGEGEVVARVAVRGEGPHRVAEEDAKVVELENAATRLAIMRRARRAHLVGVGFGVGVGVGVRVRVRVGVRVRPWRAHDAARLADLELKLNAVDKLGAAHLVRVRVRVRVRARARAIGLGPGLCGAPCRQAVSCRRRSAGSRLVGLGLGLVGLG